MQTCYNLIRLQFLFDFYAILICVHIVIQPVREDSAKKRQQTHRYGEKLFKNLIKAAARTTTTMPENSNHVVDET